MKVLFLGVDTGKAMFPATGDKFLLKFMGRTLLEHQIDTARRAGLREFIIIGSPANIGSIESIVTGIAGIRAELTVQPEPRGIANALAGAGNIINGEIIIVNPSDVFEPILYTELIKASQSGKALAYLPGINITRPFPGGQLVVAKDGRLRQIGGKPAPGNEPSRTVTPLVHLHTSPEILPAYAAKTTASGDDSYQHVLDAMARDGQRIQVVPYSGFWQAIEYPWHILEVSRWLLGQNQGYISPAARLSDKATITGNVCIEENVTVLENAVIRGPAYIGPNSVIGNNCLVRDNSHIGANCTVGNATEIKNSYIGDGCRFHMSYIGDSIIGRGCNFAAGTVLANWRFDEGTVRVNIGGETVDTGRVKFGAIIGDNCKTGVNASVMPGIKIGPNSIVGPNVCLAEDLEPDTTILAGPAGKKYGHKT